MIYKTNVNKWKPVIKDKSKDFFREANLDEGQYADFIFRRIDYDLLQESSIDERGGDTFNETFWLQKEGCQQGGLFQLPQDILYREDGRYLQKVFRLLSEADRKVTFRSFSLQAFGFSKMSHEHYLLVYPIPWKNPFLEDFALNHDKGLDMGLKYKNGDTTIFGYAIMRLNWSLR